MSGEKRGAVDFFAAAWTAFTSDGKKIPSAPVLSSGQAPCGLCHGVGELTVDDGSIVSCPNPRCARSGGAR